MNPRAILGLALFLGLVLLAFQFSKPNPPQPAVTTSQVTTKDSHGNPAQPSVPESAATESTPAVVAATSPTGQTVERQKFTEALRDCAPERLGTASVLENLLESLESESPAPKQTQWRNYQMTWSDGTERRIMIVPQEGSQTGKAWDLRFFKVDAEGLPEVEALPENIRGTQDLAQLLAQGEVLNQNEAYHLALADHEHLMIERRNGQIVDFQWRRGDKSMLCSVERCTCLR
jgi:hypothetical protein